MSVEILMDACRRLLKEATGNDSLVVEERHIPAVSIGDAMCPEHTLYIAYGNIAYPACGDTRSEAIGWMIAQARSKLPVAHPVAIEVHSLLTQHGIAAAVPSREEYESALLKHEGPC